ncbi:MAG: DUF411 domain-containing protein [Pseudomonadota bacterium]|nr:DUF411 domain-containing protein [Pseudomonadota bacterium]
MNRASSRGIRPFGLHEAAGPSSRRFFLTATARCTTGLGLLALLPQAYATYVAQMLRERRAIKGLSVPGMPTGAPGMPGNKAKPLNVYVIDTSAPPKVFATF